MEALLTSHLAAIEKVNNVLAWFEDMQQGKCTTTTTTTPCDRQYCTPTDVDAMSPLDEFCLNGEEGNDNDHTSTEGNIATTAMTTNPAVLNFYDLDVLSEVR